VTGEDSNPRRGAGQPREGWPSARNHNETPSRYPQEILDRLEGASALLTGAQAGRIDHDVAEVGALTLVDSARRWLDVFHQEALLAGRAAA